MYDGINRCSTLSLHCIIVLQLLFFPRFSEDLKMIVQGVEIENFKQFLKRNGRRSSILILFLFILRNCF